MPTQHTVVQGEDIGSLAADLGYHMNTIWDDPANKSLRELRKTPFVLDPGDVVTLPDKPDESLRSFAQGWTSDYDPRAKMR